MEEDPEGMMGRLPRNIQAGEATERIRMEHPSGARRRRVLGEEEEESEDGLLDSQEDSHDDEPMEGEWGGDDQGNLGRLVQPYDPPAYTIEQEIRMEDCKTAVGWYELFSPPEWLDYVVQESRKYAVSQGRESKVPVITKENIR